MQLNFDILNKNENTSIDFTNKGTFNMDKQTIDFNDKIYNYDNELIITDNNEIILRKHSKLNKIQKE